MAQRKGSSLIAAAKAARDQAAAEMAAAPETIAAVDAGTEGAQVGLPSPAPEPKGAQVVHPLAAAAPQHEAPQALHGATPSPAEPPAATAEYLTTAIHIPKAVLMLLRRVAVERANIQGGRPSVSAVLVDLVEKNRAELEKEAGR